MTRDEYDEHPRPWLGIGFAALAAFVAWVVWMLAAGCIYKPTINVLPIQERRGTLPTPGPATAPASAPARATGDDEFRRRIQEFVP